MCLPCSIRETRTWPLKVPWVVVFRTVLRGQGGIGLVRKATVCRVHLVVLQQLMICSATLKMSLAFSGPQFPCLWNKGMAPAGPQSLRGSMILPAPSPCRRGTQPCTWLLAGAIWLCYSDSWTSGWTWRRGMWWVAPWRTQRCMTLTPCL